MYISFIVGPPYGHDDVMLWNALQIIDHLWGESTACQRFPLAPDRIIYVKKKMKYKKALP